MPPKYKIGFSRKVVKGIVPLSKKLVRCLPILREKFLLRHNLVTRAEEQTRALHNPFPPRTHTRRVKNPIVLRKPGGTHTSVIFGTALFTSPLSNTHLGLHNRLDWPAFFSLFPSSYRRTDMASASTHTFYK